MIRPEFRIGETGGSPALRYKVQLRQTLSFQQPGYYSSTIFGSTETADPLL